METEADSANVDCRFVRRSYLIGLLLASASVGFFEQAQSHVKQRELDVFLHVRQSKEKNTQLNNCAYGGSEAGGQSARADSFETTPWT